MLKQEILKKEFFKYLNQGFENLKYIGIKEDRNKLTKHVNTLYTTFKKSNDLDEVEINNFAYQSLKLARRIEYYLDKHGKDLSGEIEVVRKIPTYEGYKRIEVEKMLNLQNYSGS